MKRNGEKCKELARLAEKVLSTMVEVIGDVPEDELDEKTKKHIKELERCILFTTSSLPGVLTTVCTVAFHRDMKEIIKIMEHLQDKPVWRRFLRKDKHSDALAKHHQGLTHTLAMFQVGFFLFTGLQTSLLTQ